MKNIRPDFEVWEKDTSEFPPGYQKITFPPGYQNITCHMIFDVKMGENFKRKARFVTIGHKTKTPAAMDYSSVMSRE